MRISLRTACAAAAALATAAAFATAARADADARAVIDNYADIAEAGYADSLAGAQSLAAAIDALLAAPGAETHRAAQDAWIAARPAYQQTEVYRFGNAIVDEWEGRVNAWPLDEGLIDYVDGGSYGDGSGENLFYTANVVANPSLTVGGREIDASVIDPALIRSLHEIDEIEANVATGYHAIEFLLWGQDLNGTGPGAGARPWTDFAAGDACTNGNCDRRGAYLSAAASLLVSDLEEMAANWRAGGAARAALEEGSVEDGLVAVITGLGSLSYGELAGERIRLGLMLHDPEEEHDCFSDNTHNSHYYDIVGIANVYTGRYVRTDGSAVEGPALSDLIRASDPALDAGMQERLAASLAAAGVVKEGRRLRRLRLRPDDRRGQCRRQRDGAGRRRRPRRADRLHRAFRARPRHRRSGVRGVGQSRRSRGCVPVGSAAGARPPCVRDRRASCRFSPAAALWLASCAAVAAAPGPEERAAILAPAADFSAAERWEALSGGSATNRRRADREAFSMPSATLSFAERADFFVGNGLFRRAWVAAPASTASADGLGPLYNARACQRCHLKDGRGHPPSGPDDSAVSMLLRLSIPPRDAEERRRLARFAAATIDDPVYGGQLQDLAVAGLPAEARLEVRYDERRVMFADGEVAHLRAPRYRIADPQYGPLHPEVMISPRVAPPMIGIGLLEAIADEDIAARADPHDADGDGISGRANRVWSASAGRVALGRFGWKAGKASVPDQAAAAMAGDIGISNPLAPDPRGDCTAAQAACAGAAHGADPAGFEAPAAVMEPLVFYSRHLAVPARRDPGAPAVLAGKELFYAAGCTGCHTPKHATRSDWPEPGGLAGQLIWPYTDLLLHDMGDGLADGRPEGAASGREWRTPPLWGIGLTGTVNGHTFFLHDGRARNLTEAVLWHGGEALAAREAFRAMSAADRAALLAFLNSL